MGPLRSQHSKLFVFRGMLFICLVAVTLCNAGCGGVAGALTSATSPPPTPNLTAGDVTTLVQAAAQAADANTMVIAVVDRAGNILAVFRKPAAPFAPWSATRAKVLSGPIQAAMLRSRT